VTSQGTLHEGDALIVGEEVRTEQQDNEIGVIEVVVKELEAICACLKMT
jgi:hypothetical protein